MTKKRKAVVKAWGVKAIKRLHPVAFDTIKKAADYAFKFKISEIVPVEITEVER